MPDVELGELRVFLAVADERSFSRAAVKMHRTQPAVSLAIRRLELKLGEQLFDRRSKDGTMTEAGRLLLDYARRLTRLAEETEAAIGELRDLRRGRVLVGCNESAVHILLPLVATFRSAHPQIEVDIRRVQARQIAVEVVQGSLDFGVLTFQPAEPNLQSVRIGSDELVMLAHPEHPFAKRRGVTMEEVGKQNVIAHNDPSPARERVLRLFQQRHLLLNIIVALPSLDGIKRAVEMELGVALLPKRCALTEIAAGRLVAVPVTGLSRKREVKLVYRRGRMSHAAEAFLTIAARLRTASQP